MSTDLRRRLALPCLAAFLLVSACGDNNVRSVGSLNSGSTQGIERAKVGYQASDATPPGLAPLVTRAPKEAVRQSLANALRLAGFKIDQDSPELIVATYQGAASRFIDCGTILPPNGAPIPATSASWSMRAKAPSSVRIVRELELRARAVMRLETEGESTRVEPQLTYALVKRVEARTAAGEILSDKPEVVVFDSGEVSRFDIGTACMSSGILEENLLYFPPGLAQAALTSPSPSTPQPTPWCPSPADQAPYCDLLAVLESAGLRRDIDARMLEDRRQIHEGDQVVLEIDRPDGLQLIRVSYVDSSGQVTNLSPILVPDDMRRLAFVTQTEVAPPFGKEAVIVLAGDASALGADRPRFESISDFGRYLDRLGGESASRVAVTYVTLMTAAR